MTYVQIVRWALGSVAGLEHALRWQQLSTRRLFTAKELQSLQLVSSSMASGQVAFTLAYPPTPPLLWYRQEKPGPDLCPDSALHQHECCAERHAEMCFRLSAWRRGARLDTTWSATYFCDRHYEDSWEATPCAMLLECSICGSRFWKSSKCVAKSCYRGSKHSTRICRRPFGFQKLAFKPRRRYDSLSYRSQSHLDKNNNFQTMDSSKSISVQQRNGGK